MSRQGRSRKVTNTGKDFIADCVNKVNLKRATNQMEYLRKDPRLIRDIALYIEDTKFSIEQQLGQKFDDVDNKYTLLARDDSVDDLVDPHYQFSIKLQQGILNQKYCQIAHSIEKEFISNQGKY